MWQYTPIILLYRKQAMLGINGKTLFEKIPTVKRGGGVTQEVECLPSQCKTMGSNPSTNKLKKKFLSWVCWQIPVTYKAKFLLGI
jgi:hypothetical protein